MVILGDMTIESAGANSLIQAGVGSGIVPSGGTVGLEVGGNIDFQRSQDTQIMVHAPTGVDVVYGGSYSTSSTGNLMVKAGRSIAPGSVDVTSYQSILADLSLKSNYWATLPANGVFTPAIQTPTQNKMIFSAGPDDDCLQVFSLTMQELHSVTWGSDVYFDSSLDGKTILINVQPEADGTSYLRYIGRFFDTQNQEGFNFDSGLKARILWNFAGSSLVTVGPENGAQLPGSILVPDGDLHFQWPGQVRHNVYQSIDSSKYRSYTHPLWSVAILRMDEP